MWIQSFEDQMIYSVERLMSVMSCDIPLISHEKARILQNLSTQSSIIAN
jgi:hypothetical protein